LRRRLRGRLRNKRRGRRRERRVFLRWWIRRRWSRRGRRGRRIDGDGGFRCIMARKLSVNNILVNIGHIKKRGSRRRQTQIVHVFFILKF